MSKRGHDSRFIALRDKEMLQNDTNKFVSPNVFDLVEVKITNVTSIFIEKNRDPKEAKETFIKNMKSKIF